MRPAVVYNGDEEFELEPESQFGDPQTDIEVREDVMILEERLEALPKELHEVIILRDYLGVSYAEIGSMLGITISTVKWRIYHARELIMEARDGKKKTKHKTSNARSLLDLESDLAA